MRCERNEVGGKLTEAECLIEGAVTFWHDVRAGRVKGKERHEVVMGIIDKLFQARQHLVDTVPPLIKEAING